MERAKNANKKFYQFGKKGKNDEKMSVLSGHDAKKDADPNVKQNPDLNLHVNVGAGASNASASNNEQISSQVNSKFSGGAENFSGGASRNDQTDSGRISDPEDIMNQDQRQVRLSTKITEIPLPVYSNLCIELNVKRPLKFDDFRMLAEKVGIKRNQALVFEQTSMNPTDEILKSWSIDREATVRKMIELLKKNDFGRGDVAEILENWVNGN